MANSVDFEMMMRTKALDSNDHALVLGPALPCICGLDHQHLKTLVTCSVRCKNSFVARLHSISVHSEEVNGSLGHYY